VSALPKRATWYAVIACPMASAAAEHPHLSGYGSLTSQPKRAGSGRLAGIAARVTADQEGGEPEGQQA
jgi:hypothetical protein